MRKSHGVVEELLELFIDKVDADLFKRIEFEYFKPWGEKLKTLINIYNQSITKKPAMSSTPIKLTFFIVGSILERFWNRKASFVFECRRLTVWHCTCRQ